MSRYSPTVAPNSGEAFGRALQQSVSAYLGARQQKQQDEADMFGHGYMPVDTSSPISGPHTPPIVEPGRPAIDQGALNTLVAKNAPPVPAPAGASMSDRFFGDGRSFGAMLGAQSQPLQVAPSAQPQGATPQSLAKAAGLDAYQPQQPAPVHLYGRDWQMTPAKIAEMAANQAMAQASLDEKRAGTAKTNRDLTTLRPQDPGYAEAMARNAAATAAATAPIEVGKARDTEQAVGPLRTAQAVASHEQDRKFDVANPLPQPPATNVYLPNYDAKTGQTTYAVAPSKGPVSITPTTLVKPPTASAGKESAADKKERTYVDMMAQSVPTMEALASKIRPDRISLALAHPTMGNLGLNQDEQSYLQAARNFLAGSLHQESGARLSAEQWAIGTQRFFPTLGDTPATIAQKTANARRTFSDRQTALTSAPPGTPNARDPGGDINLSDDSPHVQTIDELIKAGKSDAEIKAALSRRKP